MTIYNKTVKALLILMGALLLPITLTANVEAIRVIALFDGKAMISVRNQKAKIYAVGDTVGDYQLVMATTREAIVAKAGKEHRLTLDGGTLLTNSLSTVPARSGSAQLELSADTRGLFSVAGEINNNPVNFIVDTGANLVVLSGQQADRIGLDYQEGFQSRAETAAGTVPMYVILIDDVRISDGVGTIALDDVQVGVIEGSSPSSPLLGMSYLNRLKMRREGELMQLSK